MLKDSDGEGERNTCKEQVGKGGLPPLVPSISDLGTAGVNRPSRLVLCTFHFVIRFPDKLRASVVN